MGVDWSGGPRGAGPFGPLLPLVAVPRCLTDNLALYLRDGTSRIVPKVMFAYSCSISLLALWALVSSVIEPGWLLDLLSHEQSPPRWILAVGVVHLIAWIATWGPFHVRWDWLVPRYPPIFCPDRRKAQVGRAIVVATTAYWLYDWTVALSFHRGEPDRFVSFGSSIFLATGVYMAVHWALQPEYLFPQWVFSAVSWDPYTRRFGRLRAKRAALPLGQWLAGLLECCEKVAANGLLDNSAELERGEVDCLQLRAEVLTRLESRACLDQHRERLTREGFREIRRFVRAVEELDHRVANEFAWQAVTSSAKAVWALRGRIVESV
jgi:hypothetical protein